MQRYEEEMTGNSEAGTHEQKQSGIILMNMYKNRMYIMAHHCCNRYHFEFFAFEKRSGKDTVSCTHIKPGKNSLPAQRVALVPQNNNTNLASHGFHSKYIQVITIPNCQQVLAIGKKTKFVYQAPLKAM